jgi:preprotein translocase subunit SecE
LGVWVAAWQQATQQTVDLESKWYQQAAAIKEKHKVSLSFKPRAVHRFLFVFVVFIVFCLFFFVFLVCFFLFAGFQ